jgi:hypothetical protein
MLLAGVGCGKNVTTTQGNDNQPSGPPDANSAPSAQDEQKAREITLSFLKALRDKDVDAALKTTTLPFLAAGLRGKLSMLQSQGEVKAMLEDELRELTDPQELANEIVRVEPLPTARKVRKPEEQADMDLVMKAVGGSGYFMLVGKGKKDEFAILVTRKNGQVLITGMIP